LRGSVDMTSTNIVESRNEIIKYLESKIGLYLELRKILYSTIDTVHYSPSNLEVFRYISDISVRMDELYQLKMTLLGGHNNVSS
jgi:hypothetical protein